MSAAPTPLRQFLAGLCAGMVLATPAVADCLTSADLATGIRAKADDGLFEDFRRSGANLIDLSIDFGDGLVARDRMAHGIYILSGADYQDGRRDENSWVTVNFPVPIAEMPTPEENSLWEVTLMARDTLGPFEERHTYQWGAATTVVYSDCSYVAIPGAIRTDIDDGYWTMEEVQYLPQLGLSLQLAFSDMDDPQGYSRSYLSLERLEVARK